MLSLVRALKLLLRYLSTDGKHSKLMVQLNCLKRVLLGPNSIFNRRYRFQLLACLAVNFMTFAHGIASGWLSPTLTKFHSNKPPAPFDISTVEASWIGSMLGMGSFFGTLTTGCLLNLLGRKLCIYLIAVPHICHWVLIYCAQCVEYLYVARFCGGFTGGCVYVLLPIFISEIADNSIRGTLGSMLILSVNFGILTGYIVSTILTYHAMPCIVISLPVIYVMIMTIFPETPQHLLRQGKEQAAKDAFEFYKNCSGSASDEEKQSCDHDFRELKELIGHSNPHEKLSIKDFLTKPALKAQATAAILIVMNQGSGTFAFVTYMSSVFKASGTSLDPDTSTMIVGAAQIVGSCCVTIFVDRFGRKLMYLLSNGGLIVGLVSFGCFTFYAQHIDLEHYNWVPVVLMAFIIFIGNMGVVALTFVLIVEILPVKIRAMASSFCMAGISALVFLTLKLFPLLLESFGISITMWIFACVCSIGFIYLSVCLQETKGKSMDGE